ncbi:hypothetical protein CANCADRAFT_537 [Tortispora caseinolytica NRRL Y-17796]|uniref:Uncharacterized protein n=1 Tax=Tortispora caseinolytica NRRL Y-17796 TaxID=767744 RepID=A0A1E4TJV3_9ASCO|nr:hypothetical protein CANCADRAFT_537 [Tortispora caseinolytica NRRL Y-17796]
MKFIGIVLGAVAAAESMITDTYIFHETYCVEPTTACVNPQTYNVSVSNTVTFTDCHCSTTARASNTTTTVAPTYTHASGAGRLEVVAGSLSGVIALAVLLL